MTDEPAHGPDSSTPPDGSGSGKAKGKARRKGKRQRTRRKRATTATAKDRAAAGRKKRRVTPRGSFADVERLTSIVLERILLGERRAAIIRFVANAVASDDPNKRLPWPNKDGPSSRTIDQYIARANEEIAALSTVERSKAMSAARGRFLMIMRKAADTGDLSTARLANRDLARIDGLEPVRVQHSGSVITEHTGTVQHEHAARPVTIDEQASTIRELFSRASRNAAAQAAAKSN